MLAPLLIAALLTAAASEEGGDVEGRTDALRRKLFPVGRVVPATVPQLGDSDTVSSFVENGLIHFGFPKGYAESVAKNLHDDWMNMDPDLPWTMQDPWFVRYEQGPIVGRESHEPQPLPGDGAAAPFLRQQLLAMLNQIPSFEPQYFDQLVDELVDGWIYRDAEPRWETHSEIGLNAQALYWKLRSLGWPHEQAKDKSWGWGEISEQQRLLAANLPSYPALQQKDKELTEALLSAGFEPMYVKRGIDSLLYYREALQVTTPVVKGTRGIWSKAEPDPERARFEDRVYTFVYRALRSILGLSAPDANQVARFMAKDWVFESMKGSF